MSDSISTGGGTLLRLTPTITGHHLASSGMEGVVSEPLRRMSHALRTVAIREGMFSFMAVVRRATYAAGPFERFRGPGGYRGRITTMRGGGARSKFASAGFGNIIEAGARKRHLAALTDGVTARGQVTPGLLGWIRRHAADLAAELEAEGSEAIWVKPMAPRPWVLPTYYAIQDRALDAFRAEVLRQIESPGKEAPRA